MPDVEIDTCWSLAPAQGLIAILEQRVLGLRRLLRGTAHYISAPLSRSRVPNGSRSRRYQGEGGVRVPTKKMGLWFIGVGWTTRFTLKH